MTEKVSRELNIGSNEAVGQVKTGIRVTKTFRLPPELVDELELYSAKLRIAGVKLNKSEILINSLEEYFKNHPG